MAEKGIDIRPTDVILVGGLAYVLWLWFNKDKVGFRWPWEGSLIPGQDRPDNSGYIRRPVKAAFVPTNETKFIDPHFVRGQISVKFTVAAGKPSIVPTGGEGPFKRLIDYTAADKFDTGVPIPVGTTQMKWKTPDGKWYITEAKPFGPVYGGYMDPNKYDKGNAYWYIKFM
jgi:hypothetical protein